jgi:glycine cleavage system H protein
MSTLRFTPSHEWIDVDSGKMGITNFAQAALGDVVYVDLPAYVAV